MRVCYLSNTGPLMKMLTGSFVQRGYEVSLITFYSPKMNVLYDPASWENVDIHILNPNNKWRYPFTAIKIKKIVQHIKPDILHAHYVFPYGIYGMLSKYKPFILSTHGTDVYYEAWKSDRVSFKFIHKLKLDYLYFEFAHRLLHESIDLAIVGSPDLERQMRKLGYDRRLIKTAYIGVDTHKFRSNLKNQSLIDNWTENGKYGPIIFSHRALKPVYGVEYLLKAISILKDEFPTIKCIIVGDGPEKEKLKKLSCDLSLSKNVEFIGFVPHEDIPVYIASSDIVVSTSFSDTSAISILEAMSCGLPIVSTNVGSIPERVEDGKNGFLIEPGDSIALAKRIAVLICDPEMRSAMGRANRRKIVETLQFSKTVKSLEAIYAGLMEHKSKEICEVLS